MANRYSLEVSHKGLGKYRVISGSDPDLVEARVRAQAHEWEEKYQKLLQVQCEKARILNQKQRITESKEQKKLELEEKIKYAEDKTSDAQQAIESIRSILLLGIDSASPINWEKLKSYTPFDKPQPKLPQYQEFPTEPNFSEEKYGYAISTDYTIYRELPRPPDKKDPKYKPNLSIFDLVMNSRRQEKIDKCENIYRSDYSFWEKEVEQVKTENENRAAALFKKNHDEWERVTRGIRQSNDEVYAKNVEEVKLWNAEAQDYQTKINNNLLALDEQKTKYESNDARGIERYCETVLSLSKYPDNFPQDFELEYIETTEILIVDYTLPSPEHLPQVDGVKYVKARNAFVDAFLSETELNQLYDEALYQICLRSIYELFYADTMNALLGVSFNGWVKSIDKSVGKESTACVISIQVKMDEFMAVNLKNVDAKDCFKKLKGIGSSKLYSLTPVAPVLTISRNDKRFVASREIESQLDEGVNLAAMNWEDFEHLIRQLFEEEFRQSGGEVKITQASRDGGVDAIAFDPDVIRGGKTVIQAKRYTNTVGVSAVRDLYGTVLNEGASKGILVTTSDYGPDSYEFAKGKPLVLLNGGNLLSLLAKHGHKAKINLKEAKIFLSS